MHRYDEVRHLDAVYLEIAGGDHGLGYHQYIDVGRCSQTCTRFSSYGSTLALASRGQTHALQSTMAIVLVNQLLRHSAWSRLEVLLFIQRLGLLHCFAYGLVVDHTELQRARLTSSESAVALP